MLKGETLTVKTILSDRIMFEEDPLRKEWTLHNEDFKEFEFSTWKQRYKK